MSPLFGKKCSNCGFDNNNDAKFCARCGTPLAASGSKKCGVCGTENRQDAVYCKQCGRSLSANENGEIRGNHWARREGDFAVRLEISDLPGLFSKKLEIEPGTQALFYESGTPQEMLPPGIYTLDSVGKSISNWIKGIPKTATVLLVDSAPTEMVIEVPKRFTSDPLPLSLKMRLVVEVEEAAKFLLTALRGRERYSMQDLRFYIEPEVAAVTDNYLSHRTLEQLAQNPATRSELEIAVEEALRTTFKQYGLKLVSLRTVELDLQAYDKIKGIKGNYSLLVEEGEANLNGRIQEAGLANKNALQDLAEKTSEVENEERKIEIYQRVRQAAVSDQMNEVRTKADFEQFMDGIDRQKLLSKKEREDLLQGWLEAAEDHNRGRNFLIQKSDLEQKFQLQAIEIKSNGELSLQQQDYQLQLIRRQAENDQEIKKRQLEIEIEQKKAVADQDFAEMQRLKDLSISLHRDKMQLEKEEATWKAEIENTQKDADHRREMERLAQLGTLGTEALIVASPAEQGRILQDLKRMEMYKTMSDEQILALAAEKSPELGKVFEEKFRSIAEGKANDRERELYEKLLADNKSTQGLLIETQKDAMNRMQHMSEHDVDAIKDISTAYAQRGDSVIIAGTNGNNVARVSRSGATNSEEDVKICPSCGRQVTVSSRFCPFCSNEFKDIK